MLLFLLLLLPCALISYSFVIKDKKIILTVFAGLVTALLVCGCRFLFSFEHRLIYDSFADNFAYYLLKENLLPLVVVAAIYALFSRDKAEYKVNNFFPLLTSFYAVYLPYCVISASEYYYQGYNLFLKPVIYLAMLSQIALSLISLYKAAIEKKPLFIVMNIFIILLFAIYPALSDALYAIDYNFAIILIIGLVYSLIPFAFFVIRQIRNK